jgi:pimeloyl-ACP methyl ester carboxylesterase
VPTAKLGDLALYYQEHGAGYPLILTHGFGGTADFWEPQVAGLADRYRVISYDARGHGRSTGPSDPTAYDEALYAADLRGLMDHLGLARACLGGLSMGANIALRFGLAYPERAAGLVLCNAGTGSDDPPAWQQRCERLARALEKRGVGFFAELVLNSPAAGRIAERGPQAVGWLREMLVSHQPASLVQVLRYEQATRPTLYSLEPALRGFTKPVLVVSGEHDEPTLRPSRFLAETLPKGQLLMLAGAGHLTTAEQPELVNAALRRFLEGLG